MPFNWFKKSGDTPPLKPDYDTVDSMDKAIELYNKKQLSKIYLMPLEFGGEDAPLNTLYVPEHVQVFKSRLDNMVEDLLVHGKKIGYSVKPQYKGKSFVPSAITIIVNGEVQMEETIEAW